MRSFWRATSLSRPYRTEAYGIDPPLYHQPYMGHDGFNGHHHTQGECHSVDDNMGARYGHACVSAAWHRYVRPRGSHHMPVARECAIVCCAVAAVPHRHGNL